MNKYVALLRGINVKGKNLIKMTELREAFESLGLTNVETYIQSGNVVFTTDIKSEEKLETLISNKIDSEFNIATAVWVRDYTYLQEILENNPFLKRGEDEKTLYVTFVREHLSEEFHDLMKGKFVDEDYDFGNRCVYIYCKYSYGKAKLNNKFIEATQLEYRQYSGKIV